MKRYWLGASVLGLMSAISACGNEGVATDEYGDEARALGDVALGLLLPDGSSVSSVEYLVTRAGVTVSSGSVPVAANGTATVAINGLEAGGGYSVRLVATRDAGSSCEGEANFAVIADQTTAVNVILQCADLSATGNIAVNGSFNICPKAGASTLSPTTVQVGASTAITFVASDKDGDAISYAWTASDGTFSAPNAANTSYTCASAGAKALRLTYTDGPSRGCTQVSVLNVNCVGGVDGGVDGGIANIQILAFNDFHGNIEPPTGSNGLVSPGRNLDGGVLPSVDAGGAAFFARHIANLKAQNPNTVVVSAGDLINASPLASALFRDEPTIDAMNLIGLDINAVGNHEFDDGRAELLRMQNGGCPPEGCADGGAPFAGASFQFLSANVRTEDGGTLFPRYTVKQLDGVKVAFIGMTLEGTPGIVTPAGVQGLTFYDEADTVNMIVPELQAQGIKAIAVIVHEGGFQSSGTINECNGISGPIVDIVQRLHPEVDLIVSGHTHAAYNCVIDNRRVTSALAFGRLVTQIQLLVDRTTQQVVSVTAENRVATRDVPVVPAVQAVVDDAVSRVAPLRDRVIGTASAPLSRTNNASGEAPLGDIIADAQRASTFEAGNPLPQVAFMNPGGVRADIDQGPINYGEAFTVQPFGNGTVAMTLSGEQLKNALEQQFVGFMGQTTQRILYASANVAYSWSASAPVGSKIVSLTIDGQPLNPAGSYRVTVNSFLATGGDGFSVFNLGGDRIGGDLDIDALEKYLASQPNATIAPPPSTRVTRIP